MSIRIIWSLYSAIGKVDCAFFLTMALLGGTLACTSKHHQPLSVMIRVRHAREKILLSRVLSPTAYHSLVVRHVKSICRERLLQYTSPSSVGAAPLCTNSIASFFQQFTTCTLTQFFILFHLFTKVNGTCYFHHTPVVVWFQSKFGEQ